MRHDDVVALRQVLQQFGGDDVRQGEDAQPALAATAGDPAHEVAVAAALRQPMLQRQQDQIPVVKADDLGKHAVAVSGMNAADFTDTHFWTGGFDRLAGKAHHGSLTRKQLYLVQRCVQLVKIDQIVGLNSFHFTVRVQAPPRYAAGAFP